MGEHMDVENAFTQDAIAATGVDVENELEAQVRDMIQRVCQANEVELDRSEENVAVLCFVAGRAYQSDLSAGVISIDMSPDTASEFIHFLTQRGET